MSKFDGDEFSRQMKEAMENGGPLPDFPSDMTPLNGLTAAMAEQFHAFCDQEEFSRREALYLTAAMFTQTPGTPPPA